MKDVELKLIAELMKNSRRSDRELSKIIGVSQPTITRLRTKLEKEGSILEYTMTPNLTKLGYHLFALTFISLKSTLSPEEVEKVRKIGQEQAQNAPPNIIVIERGMGLGFAGLIGSLHPNYASYAELIDEMKQSPYIDSKIESFIINLDEKVHLRHLSMRTLAEDLLTLKKKNEE